MIPLEIERKFLIKQTAGIDENCSEKIEIVQTYLQSSDNEIQRRVRKMSINGNDEFFYTEKKFISPMVREENEREISDTEYNSLLSESDKSLKSIKKTRQILIYNSQRFEIDSYPFSSELATMELELSSEDQEIDFPPFISVIKEVTGDKSYSNAKLALNGKFPD